MPNLTIDDKEIEVKEGETILKAAEHADIYIPRICYHPDLTLPQEAKPIEVVYRGKDRLEKDPDSSTEYQKCNLCIVKLKGSEDFVTSCDTFVQDGMIIQTNTPDIIKARRDYLVPILSKHPHACLTCAQRKGCTREPCSTNVPVEERCCSKLGRCELQQVAEYVGIREDITGYKPQGLPIFKDDPLYERDYNLCIGCTRCIRACNDLKGIKALGFVYRNGEVKVGTVAESLDDSGCKFCTTCVEVCPTGALMDIGIDWTQRETQLVPCKKNCPVGIDVPLYVHLVAEGRPSDSLSVIREKVPFPSVLGDVCFHPCEEECRRGKLNEPIAICSLKRFASENDNGSWKEKIKVVPSTNKKIAVVGAGPTGLSAAFYLSKLGHTITVFDSLSQPGGMMRIGIPEYRLPKEVLQLETNSTIGDNNKLIELKNQYDAVLLALGAQLSRKIAVEGMESEGILWGIDFLRDVHLKKDIKVRDRVLVIGGGNVAVDVAMTALRLGSKEVHMVCLESKYEMPAHEWEIKDAEEEGIIIHNCWGPRRILNDGKSVTGMEFIRCASVFDEQSKFNPKFDESQKNVLETDLIILAIGQASDLAILNETQIKSSAGMIKVNTNSETDERGIFAAGEVVKAPSSVVEAISAGRQAAISIDKFLGGEGEIDDEFFGKEKRDVWVGREENFAHKKRVDMPRLPVEKRIKTFDPIDLGYSEKEAMDEAKRCLKCDLRNQISSINLPPEELLDFNTESINNIPEGAGVIQLMDENKLMIYIKGSDNIRRELLDQLKSNNKAKYFMIEEAEMYTSKESEMISEFLQQHGHLPEFNDLGDDLF
jgi:NADPH-dependent glutamate synthase beta subunit-like oxidoreductase/Pyruvate/2-oxoacid:ferredoxin oxidoreductase delta subunit